MKVEVEVEFTLHKVYRVDMRGRVELWNCACACACTGINYARGPSTCGAGSYSLIGCPVLP